MVAVFDDHGVAFVLVGGVAARTWGAERPTKDLDAVVATDGINLARVAEALNEVGARLRVEGMDDETARQLSPPVTGDWLSRLELSTWQTDLGAVDVLKNIPDREGAHLDYDRLAARSTAVDVDGVIVQIASLEDIIASKRWADRPKDREALVELAEIQTQPNHDVEADEPGFDIT